MPHPNKRDWDIEELNGCNLPLPLSCAELAQMISRGDPRLVVVDVRGTDSQPMPTPIHLDFLHRFITLHWIQVVMVNVSPGSGEWVPSRQVAIYNRATIQLLWKFFQTACRSYVRVLPRGLRGLELPWLSSSFLPFCSSFTWSLQYYFSIFW